MELNGKKYQRELQDLFESRYPLIFIRSSEESLAIDCVVSAHQAIINSSNIKDDRGQLFIWSKTNGFLQLSFDDAERKKWNKLHSADDTKVDTINQALNALQKQLEEQVANKKANSLYTYILPDWSAFIENNSLSEARKLKELVISIQKRSSQPKMTLVILGHDWTIPAILRNFVHILDLALPTKEELYEKLFKFAVEDRGITDEQANRLSEQAQGMPLQAATQVAMLISTKNLWSEPEKAKQLLLEIKKQEIRKTGVLEYYEPQGQGLNDVGGLKTLQAWIRSRHRWFQRNDQPKLRPRAILLEGYPGCGKSFIARAIALEWGLPQINFEISRLQSKYVGESESNTYQALRLIEASAPNILFMDEIEKAFSGVGGDSTPVGTRQFGTFLSWLNDHNYPIFFIATSNDRSKLPPELFRAGRFDEIFIIMPPNQTERQDIIQKIAKNYNISLSESTLNFLAVDTLGFSGAELEKLVKETILSYGFSPNEVAWKEVLGEIKPQYRTRRMQELLQNYMTLIKEGGGKPASPLSEEPDFWAKLIVTKD